MANVESFMIHADANRTRIIGGDMEINLKTALASYPFSESHVVVLPLLPRSWVDHGQVLNRHEVVELRGEDKDIIRHLNESCSLVKRTKTNLTFLLAKVRRML